MSSNSCPASSLTTVKSNNSPQESLNTNIDIEDEFEVIF